jgi:hypothetical protein
MVVWVDAETLFVGPGADPAEVLPEMGLLRGDTVAS